MYVVTCTVGVRVIPFSKYPTHFIRPFYSSTVIGITMDSNWMPEATDADADAEGRRKSITWSEHPHVCFLLSDYEDDDVSCITSPTLEASDNNSRPLSNPNLGVFCSEFWDRQGKRCDDYLTYHVDNSLATFSKVLSPGPTDEDDTFLGSLLSYQAGSCASLSLSDGSAPSLQGSEHSDDDSSISSAPLRLAGILRPSSYGPRDGGGKKFNSRFVLVDKNASIERPSLINRSTKDKKVTGKEAKAVYRIEVVLAEKPIILRKKRSAVKVTKLIVDAKAKQMKAALSAVSCMSSKPMVTADDSRDELASNLREKI